ncbi:FAD-dependent oxidoreductase [Actinokineospora sp. NBRC 105648]|uniref:FAD-dependent oxidoreductase n=1 Tax=Actinokineospora sp. NBRC 105648 TaxID=3032206 RepID=UPI0024A5F38A|nr:FAD-dependent oxidoreductase [Actinokineospora sp. NBRC 105648]GLZ37336.1 oxidoreductase [Actinokineospora sp. NBRC 105648]
MSFETDTVIVGAGLAGLAAAKTLTAAGREVIVLEAGEAPGGRVRTDRVGKLLLDRGFQVFNAGYPAAQDLLDIEALALRPFVPSALVSDADGLHLVADPRRRPGSLGATLRAPIGSVARKLMLGAYAAALAAAPAKTLRERDDRPFRARLADYGITGPVLDRFLRPFLAGVFLDPDLTVPSRFAEFVLRSFARGAIGVPRAGMRAIPDQLAAGLPAGAVKYSFPIREVAPGRVTGEFGTVTARSVVVAVDGTAAHRLLGERVPAPGTRGCVTHYHLADSPPVAEAAIVLDGLGRGPLTNSVVLTNAAPEYAPGAVLVSSTSLGTEDPGEAAVRAHLAQIYHRDTSAWEHVRSYRITEAVPIADGPLRKPVSLGEGLYVCGDHRDTPSIQGALVSGRRTAQAVLRATA